MIKLTATNTVNDGMMMDMNPLISLNTVTTYCLNGTIITLNGNEYVLQNDMGNGRVHSAYLPKGYVPLGTCSFGGIIYIVSYNPFTKMCLIGSFPSPQRNIMTNTDTPSVIDLNSFIGSRELFDNTNSNAKEPIMKSKSISVKLSNIKISPGDEYLISGNVDNYKEVLSSYGSLDITELPKLYRILIFFTDKNGNKTDITSLQKKYENNFYIKESEQSGSKVDDFRSLIQSAYNILNTDTSGYLSVHLELETISRFSSPYRIFPNKDDQNKRDIYFLVNWETIRDNCRDIINPSSIKIRIKNYGDTPFLYIPNITMDVNKDEEGKVNNLSLPKIKYILGPNGSIIATYDELKPIQKGLNLREFRVNDGKDSRIIVGPITVKYTDVIDYEVSPYMNIGNTEYNIQFLRNTGSIDVKTEYTDPIILLVWKYLYSTEFENENLKNYINLDYGFKNLGEDLSITKGVIEFYKATSDTLVVLSPEKVPINDYNGTEEVTTLQLDIVDGTSPNYLYEMPQLDLGLSGTFSLRLPINTGILEGNNLYFAKIILYSLVEGYNEPLKVAIFKRFLYTSSLFNGSYNSCLDFDILTLDAENLEFITDFKIGYKKGPLNSGINFDVTNYRDIHDQEVTCVNNSETGINEFLALYKSNSDDVSNLSFESNQKVNFESTSSIETKFKDLFSSFEISSYNTDIGIQSNDSIKGDFVSSDFNTSYNIDESNISDNSVIVKFNRDYKYTIKNCTARYEGSSNTITDFFYTPLLPTVFTLLYDDKSIYGGEASTSELDNSKIIGLPSNYPYLKTDRDVIYLTTPVEDLFNNRTDTTYSTWADARCIGAFYFKKPNKELPSEDKDLVPMWKYYQGEWGNNCPEFKEGALDGTGGTGNLIISNIFYDNSNTTNENSAWEVTEYGAYLNDPYRYYDKIPNNSYDSFIHANSCREDFIPIVYHSSSIPPVLTRLLNSISTTGGYVPKDSYPRIYHAFVTKRDTRDDVLDLVTYYEGNVYDDGNEKEYTFRRYRDLLLIAIFNYEGNRILATPYALKGYCPEDNSTVDFFNVQKLVENVKDGLGTKRDFYIKELFYLKIINVPTNVKIVSEISNTISDVTLNLEINNVVLRNNLPNNLKNNITYQLNSSSTVNINIDNTTINDYISTLKKKYRIFSRVTDSNNTIDEGEKGKWESSMACDPSSETGYTSAPSNGLVYRDMTLKYLYYLPESKIETEKDEGAKITEFLYGNVGIHNILGKKSMPEDKSRIKWFFTINPNEERVYYTVGITKTVKNVKCGDNEINTHRVHFDIPDYSEKFLSGNLTYTNGEAYISGTTKVSTIVLPDDAEGHSHSYILLGGVKLKLGINNSYERYTAVIPILDNIKNFKALYGKK